MCKAIKVLTFLIMFGTSAELLADKQDDAQKGTEEHMAVEAVSPWEFGIALGFGKQSNPILLADDINLNIMLHLAYFGERFAFINGDLSYRLVGGNDWQVNLIAHSNAERFFHDNVNKLGLVLDLDATSRGDYRTVVINDPEVGAINGNEIIDFTPPDRDATVDSGLELQLDGTWGNIDAYWITDISGQHSGQEIFFNYAKRLQNHRLVITPSLGLIYKDKKWTNYFYGIRENEVIPIEFASFNIRDIYKPGAAINPFLKLQAQYRLSKHWQVIALFEEEFLDQTIKDSPIVDDSRVRTTFFGIYFQF